MGHFSSYMPVTAACRCRQVNHHPKPEQQWSTSHNSTEWPAAGSRHQHNHNKCYGLSLWTRKSSTTLASMDKFGRPNGGLNQENSLMRRRSKPNCNVRLNTYTIHRVPWSPVQYNIGSVTGIPAGTKCSKNKQQQTHVSASMTPQWAPQDTSNYAFGTMMVESGNCLWRMSPQSTLNNQLYDHINMHAHTSYFSLESTDSLDTSWVLPSRFAATDIHELCSSCIYMFESACQKLCCISQLVACSLLATDFLLHIRYDECLSLLLLQLCLLWSPLHYSPLTEHCWSMSET